MDVCSMSTGYIRFYPSAVFLPNEYDVFGNSLIQTLSSNSAVTTDFGIVGFIARSSD